MAVLSFPLAPRYLFFLKTNSECSEMLLEFFERIGSLVPEYWSLKSNFKPEINSFFLSGRGYSINDFSTISAFIGEIPNEKRLHLFGSACLN